jgi:hypothetical protein
MAAFALHQTPVETKELREKDGDDFQHSALGNFQERIFWMRCASRACRELEFEIDFSTPSEIRIYFS